MTSATSSTASSSHLTALADDKPNQPTKFHFPQREFGKASVVFRSFQPQWFKRWPWLHYREEGDLAFCFTCMTAFRNQHLHAVSIKEQSFISVGFCNWKDASKKFNKHLESHCHKEAVLKTTATVNVCEMLSSGLAKEHLERR